MWSSVIILTKVNLPEAVPYYCMRCRHKLFHINREVMVMWQGEGYPEREIPRGMGMAEIKCSGCPSKYTFYYQ